MRSLVVALLGLLSWAWPLSAKPPLSNTQLKQQVFETEKAFAATMAARDFKGFTAFIAAEAVFLSDQGPLRGREAVCRHWQRFFEKPTVPFSWAPETVEVLASGTLALSTGPVYDPTGKRVATFSSIWRLESDHQWRIVFDKGDPFSAEPRP